MQITLKSQTIITDDKTGKIVAINITVDSTYGEASLRLGPGAQAPHIVNAVCEKFGQKPPYANPDEALPVDSKPIETDEERLARIAAENAAKVAAYEAKFGTL